MQNLLHMHWLWVFGALWLGIALGWATALPIAARWTVRPVHLAIGAAGAAALLVVAQMVPVRWGYRLEVGVVLAVIGAIGCFIGWALRDIAEFTPAATRPATAAAGAPSGAAETGSYLFRDALAGMGAGPAYMRATTGQGGHAGRERPVPSAASLAQAPAPGGYTFPKTLPFADATTSRRAAPTPGRLRHWSW